MRALDVRGPYGGNTGYGRLTRELVRALGRERVAWYPWDRTAETLGRLIDELEAGWIPPPETRRTSRSER